VITSSSVKQHQTEGEEMNEEPLNGSFQLLILQLKPGAVCSPQILRITVSVRERLLCETEPGIPFYHHLHLGIFTPKSPLTCRSLRHLPAQGLKPLPRSNYRRHKTELDPPLATARRETPATATSRTPVARTERWLSITHAATQTSPSQAAPSFSHHFFLPSHSQRGLRLRGLIQLHRLNIFKKMHQQSTGRKTT